MSGEKSQVYLVVIESQTPQHSRIEDEMIFVSPLSIEIAKNIAGKQIN